MKMTGIHECALQITIAKMVDAGEEEYTGGLREILSLVRGLADGSLRCADSTTEVVVEREELERMRDMFVDLAADPNTATTIAYKDVRRWLSTPEQPAPSVSPVSSGEAKE